MKSSKYLGIKLFQLICVIVSKGVCFFINQSENVCPNNAIDY